MMDQLQTIAEVKKTNKQTKTLKISIYGEMKN